MEQAPNNERTIEEAWVVNAGFTVLRDLGVEYDSALQIASDDELVRAAYMSSQNRGERMVEMVALILQQPALETVELTVRN